MTRVGNVHMIRNKLKSEFNMCIQQFKCSMCVAAPIWFLVLFPFYITCCLGLTSRFARPWVYFARKDPKWPCPVVGPWVTVKERQIETCNLLVRADIGILGNIDVPIHIPDAFLDRISWYWNLGQCLMCLFHVPCAFLIQFLRIGILSNIWWA